MAEEKAVQTTEKKGLRGWLADHALQVLSGSLSFIVGVFLAGAWASNELNAIRKSIGEAMVCCQEAKAAVARAESDGKAALSRTEAEGRAADLRLADALAKQAQALETHAAKPSHEGTAVMLATNTSEHQAIMTSLFEIKSALNLWRRPPGASTGDVPKASLNDGR